MSVKSYAYSARDRLTKNFIVSEFRCKCGRGHATLLDPALPAKVQQLMAAIGAVKGIVTSGYRCPYWDKAVKGTGYGMHTKGLAADWKFYRQDGSLIRPEIVACKAQDLGFSGIGKIDNEAIHLDIGPRHWWGDETVPGGTSGSVTTDYYRYYGIKRSGHIAELQQILNGLGHSLAVDDLLGPKTLAAVKLHTVDLGDKGELVRWVQERLTSLGYRCGSIDGIAGSLTMAAINAWQRANRLGEGYLGGSDWPVLLS